MSVLGFLAHLWGAFAIPVVLSVVRRLSYVFLVFFIKGCLFKMVETNYLPIQKW